MENPVEDPDDLLLPEDDSVFSNVSYAGGGHNISSDALVEDSFSHELNVPTSTPVKVTVSNRGGKGRGRSRGNPSSSGVASSTFSSPPTIIQRLPCPNCKNTYANERTLAVHLKMHVMKGISARAASLSDIQTNMEQLLQSTLLDLRKEPAVGDLGESFQIYCQCVSDFINEQSEIKDSLLLHFSSLFSNILKSQNALLPSAIRTAVHIGTNKILSLQVEIECLKGYFLKIKEVADDVLNIFMGCLLLNLSCKIISYALKKIRGVEGRVEEVRKKRSDDNTQSETFLELVHYIGGSIVSGFLWRGEKYKTSSRTWTVFLDVIKSKFLMNMTSSVGCSTVSSFTESQDRGGLKYVSQEAFDFFVVAFDWLMCQEGEDGSLPPDVIDNLLQNNVVLCLWDDLVGGDLTEEQSIDLLMRFSECCKRVVSKGIMKRRLNNNLKKSYSSVPLRSRLAR